MHLYTYLCTNKTHLVHLTHAQKREAMHKIVCVDSVPARTAGPLGQQPETEVMQRGSEQCSRGQRAAGSGQLRRIADRTVPVSLERDYSCSKRRGADRVEAGPASRPTGHCSQSALVNRGGRSCFFLPLTSSASCHRQAERERLKRAPPERLSFSALFISVCTSEAR